MSNRKKHLIAKALKDLKKRKLGTFDRLIIVLAVGGIFLMSFYVFTLSKRVYQHKDIQAMLPVKETVGYIELSDFQIPTKLQNTIGFKRETIEALVQSGFGLELSSVLKNWTAHPFGIALIQDDQNASRPVLFMEIDSKRRTLKALEKQLLPNQKLNSENGVKHTIYSYPQGNSFHFTFALPYLFIANESEILELIQTVREDQPNSLREQSDYQKSISQLPRQSWMNGYLNINGLRFKDNFTLNNFIDPLKFGMNHLAWTVRRNPNGFHFNTFANLNKKLLTLKKTSHENSKFIHQITNNIDPENLGIYIGGENLSNEWQNTLETIANLNPAYGVILESILRAQVTRIFGQEVDLRNDLYPLFEGEYGLALGWEKGLQRITLILSHNDKKFAITKLEKLLEGFQYLAGQFTPKVHIVELPDGTVSKEMVANDERPQREEEKYQENEVNCVDTEDSASAFCYTVTNELIIISNDQGKVFDALDFSPSPEGSLSTYQPFRQTLNNVSKVNDEITFINIQNSLTLLGKHPYALLAQPLLEPFEALAWVKHYFEDGVSTDGYLLIK